MHSFCLKKYLLPPLVGVICVCCFYIQARSQTLSGWAEAGTYIGNNSRLPFFMRANQYGTVPLFKPDFSAHSGIHFKSLQTSFDSTQRHVHQKPAWEIKSELVFNSGNESTKLLLPEAFGKIRWKKMEFWAGRRKEIIGIVDTTLSSGSFTWSGNALPVPKIQIGFPEYVSVGFLKNYIAFKGFFAHGWYNTPYIKGAYLHQKSLYIRLGKPDGKFNIQAGLVHHVTWGGHADYLKTSPHVINGRMTDSFKDYIRGVVLGKVSKDFHNSRYTNFDGENRIGNHIGQIDFAIEYKLKTSKLLLYNNHPFEDASGLLFQNMPDGLYGLSWKKNKQSNYVIQIKGVLVEYLYTKDQSGIGWNVSGSRFKGNDNYFNHQQYIEGWSYFGKGLGNPLLAPKSEIRPERMDIREFFPNTKVVAYQLALEGSVMQQIHWLAKASVSRNYGTNNIPYSPYLHKFSSLLTIDSPLLQKANLRLLVKVAYDHGELFVTSLAVYLGIKYSVSTK